MNGTIEGQLRIAVLDRGFVYVGHCHVQDGFLTITDARNVRRWGTSGGLGQLAAEGPQPQSRIDQTGTVTAPLNAVVHLIDCNEAAWAPEAAAA